MSKIVVSLDSASFKDMEELNAREELLESLGFEGLPPHDDGNYYQRYFSVETERLIQTISKPFKSAQPQSTKQENSMSECEHLSWRKYVDFMETIWICNGCGLESVKPAKQTKD